MKTGRWVTTLHRLQRRKAPKGSMSGGFSMEMSPTNTHWNQVSTVIIQFCLLTLCNLVFVVVNLKITNTGIDKSVIPLADVLCIVQLSQVGNSKQFSMTQKELDRCVALGERDYNGKVFTFFTFFFFAFLFALCILEYLYHFHIKSEQIFGIYFH